MLVEKWEGNGCYGVVHAWQCTESLPDSVKDVVNAIVESKVIRTRHRWEAARGTLMSTVRAALDNGEKVCSGRRLLDSFRFGMNENEERSVLVYVGDLERDL